MFLEFIQVYYVHLRVYCNLYEVSFPMCHFQHRLRIFKFLIFHAPKLNFNTLCTETCKFVNLPIGKFRESLYSRLAAFSFDDNV